MPIKPLVSKIRCDNPHSKSAAVHNYNYILYIATRSGVDLSVPASDLSDESGSAGHSASAVPKFAQCHGLFGNFDTSNLNHVALDVRHLTASGTNIYRGLVSLDEEDAITLDYTKKDTWISYMNSIMSDVAGEFGIPITSLRWCAAVHMEQGHPHCHYAFWRNDGKSFSSFIPPAKQNSVREFLSGEMFKQERKEEIPVKNSLRDNLISETKDIITSLTEYIHIPERIAAKQLSALSKDLFDLAHALPGRGRLSYKLLPPACKEILKRTIDDLLKIPSVQKEYAAYQKSLQKISETYSPSHNHKITTASIQEDEILKRIANTILSSAKDFLLTEHALTPSEPNSVELSNTSTELSSPDLYYASTELDSVEFSDTWTELDSPDFHGASTELGSVQPFRKWWSKDFKEQRSNLYALDINDEQYHDKLKLILSSLEKMHLSGNRAATLILAKTYNSAKYPVQDKELAGKYYRTVYSDFCRLISTEACSQNDYMNFQLAKICENGYGRDVDYEEAIRHYKACSDSNPYACYALAKIYLSGKNSPLTEETYTQAMVYLERSSLHIPYAAFDYAAELEKDRFRKYNDNAGTDISELIQKKYTYALEAFLKQEITDKNDDNVLYRIGTMYYKGQGCTSDPEKAYTYFLRAAKLHNRHAYYALGKTCADTTSPHYNPNLALEYYKNAVGDDAEPPAYIINAMAALYAAPDTGLYNIDRAIELYLSAAKSGDIHSHYSLGRIYADQESPHYNPKLALEHFRNAIKNVLEPPAYITNAMAALYATPDTEFYDIDRAINLYHAAAQAGDTCAMRKLGSIYLFGKGVKRDEELGLLYINKAVDSGDAYAKETLEFYNTMKHHMAVSFSYSLIQTMLHSWGSHQNRRALLSSSAGSRSLSKEARKTEAKKNQEHSYAQEEQPDIP